MPDWVLIHLMAKDYAVPPWIIEEECTSLWLKRWSEFKAAEGQESKRLADKAKKDAGVRRHG